MFIKILLEALDDKDPQSEKIKTTLLDRMLFGLLSADETDATKYARQNWFQGMIFDKVGSHMVQLIIKVAPTSVYNKMYDALLKGKLLGYSKHHVANYVVQSVLANARTAGQIKEMATELGGFKSLLENGKYGVVRTVVQASANLKTMESEVMDWLLEAFGVSGKDDQKELANCLIRMKSLEVWIIKGVLVLVLTTIIHRLGRRNLKKNDITSMIFTFKAHYCSKTL